MNTRLRVGLLLDAVPFSAWTFTALERVAHSNHAELTLVILNRSHPGQGPVRSHWLYRFFNAIDEKLFLRQPNALRRVDDTKLVAHLPVLHVTPVDENGKQRFVASDVQQIKSYRLDVLVKLGFGDLTGEVLSAANHGVWAYRWGDHNQIEDELAGFLEVAAGCPETSVALQRLGEQQNQTLFESWFFTYPYSAARSRNYLLWAAASFLPRQLEQLQRLGSKNYFQGLKLSEAQARTLKGFPSRLEVLGIMLRLVTRNLLEIGRRIFLREQWNLFFHFGPETTNDMVAFERMPPPNDCFWADPHVIYREPAYYIFIEEYPFRKKRGHISVIEMDRQGNYKPPIPVLQEDYHLSFPFVFTWMGSYYMIPESSENKTINLYESIKFPYAWRLKMTLMKDVTAVDTTIFYHQGKWWLFTAMSEQPAAAPQVELFLFYSDQLITDRWSPHPMNPIVSDVKKARGAGSLFQTEGKLYRPSQDCSKAYGYGFDLNEIVTLSETQYCERTVRSVRPDSMKSILATHTYASQEDLTVVDALTRRPKWAKTA